MPKSLIIISGFIMVLLIAALTLMQYRLFLKQAVLSSNSVIEINKGDSLDAISKQLALTLPIKPFWFKCFAYQSRLAHRLKAGEYELSAGASSFDILQQLSEGKTKKYAITFPEGWSFKQILQIIKDNPNLQHTLANDNPLEFIKKLDTSYAHPEGLLFPDTYFFEKHSSDIDLLKRAYHKMQNILNEEWLKRDQELPLQNPYQALILASIIEKETAVAEERQEIAGVFSRRLKKGMLLQTDPTVIYGLGDNYHGNIRYQDLHQDNPYNTYLKPGLPPTPIAMPGKPAIFAALHPDHSDKLYFVSRGDGHHVFSATLAEHHNHVNQYQR